MYQSRGVEEKYPVKHGHLLPALLNDYLHRQPIHAYFYSHLP